MTFLTPLMLFGAAAAAVPLVIHLLHRTRYQTVAWGAMHLLQDVVATSRRRLRWHQWLLLLVRCLIPVALALMMARPILTGFRMLAGDTPIGLVVVLDDSASMNAEAAAATEAILRAAPRGSDLAVVVAGSPPKSLLDRPTTSADRLIDAVGSVQFIHDAAAIEESLALAKSIAASLSQPSRELVVVSDFQARDWADVTTGPPADDRSGNELTRTTWLPIPSQPAATITDIQLPTRPVAAGQSVSVRVAVFDPDGGPAEVVIDSASIDRQSQTIELIAGREQVVDFVVRIDEADADIMTATLRRGDVELGTTAAVLDPLRTVTTLLVDGQPSSEPLGGEVGFLALALGPLGQVGADGRDLFDIRTTAANGLADALTEERSSPNLVVLANVGKLPDNAVSALDRYVRSGGAVWLTAGESIDAEWQNETLGSAGLLPRLWGPVQSSPTSILPETYTHPSVTAFNDDTFGSLDPVQISRWFRLDLPDDASGRDDQTAPVVVLRMRDGSPLLVESTVGEGVVLQWATTIDDAWTDLPRQVAFVPLVQQIGAATVARSRPPRNLRPGQPIRRTGRDEAMLVPPEGPREPVGGGQSVVTTTTRTPGSYRVLTGDRSEPWVVSIDPAEPSAPRLTSAEIVTLAESLGATVADDASDYLDRDQTRRFGRDAWGDLWKLLLGLLVVEILLQQRRPRPAAASPAGGLSP